MTQGFENALAELREQATELCAIVLTGPLQPSQISPIAKIPFKTRVLRECLLHRVSELANSIIPPLEASQAIASVVLARAALEPAALLCWLHRKVDRAVQVNELGDLDAFIMKGLFGRRDGDPAIKAHNVLSALQRVDQWFKLELGEVDVASKYYALLSEIAHPNYEGVVSPFVSKGTLEETVIGPQSSDIEANLMIAQGAMKVAIGISARFHKSLSELDTQFRLLCEKELVAGDRGDRPAT